MACDDNLQKAIQKAGGGRTPPRKKPAADATIGKAGGGRAPNAGNTGPKKKP